MEDVFYSANMHRVGTNCSEVGRVAALDHRVEDEEGFRMSSSSSTVVQLNGVDAEAEKFIDRFYRRLSLERQRSTDEFFAVLNRGS